MYLLIITIGLCLAYVFFYFLFPLFFRNTTVALSAKSLYSILYIVIFIFLAYEISLRVADYELSNRFLHIFGGGFVSFLICFLAVKDSKLSLGRFQFFIFGVLLAIALGVANEILEFFLQRYFNMDFAKTATDTWLDLISNTVGALIAAACLTPFIKKST